MISCRTLWFLGLRVCRYRTTTSTIRSAVRPELQPEGAKVGYKWFEATHKQPLFPFGFGLSYTTYRLLRSDRR